MTSTTSLPANVSAPYPPVTGQGEQPAAVSASFLCDLWMIDHGGSTALHCRCLESSPDRMRLRAPLGYGLAEGQHYELCVQPPGARPPALFGLTDRRWATVVEVRLCLDETEDYVEVTVALNRGEDAIGQNLGGPVS
jgi:hypothetical protein